MKTVKEHYVELICDGQYIGSCRTEQLARKLANEKELILDLCEFKICKIDVVIVEKNDDIKELIEKEIYNHAVSKLTDKEWQVVQDRLNS